MDGGIAVVVVFHDKVVVVFHTKLFLDTKNNYKIFVCVTDT